MEYAISKNKTTSILKHVECIYFNQFGTEESVEKLTSAQRRNLKTHIGSLGESTVPNLPRLQSKVNEHSDQGWALFKRKKAVAFSSKIKGFLMVDLPGRRENQQHNQAPCCLAKNEKCHNKHYIDIYH
jgi:hypothetical protein